MSRYVALCLPLLCLAGCVELPEGRIACGPSPENECPQGWFCHPSDNMCRRTPPDAAVRDAGMDAGSADAGRDAGIDGGPIDSGPRDAGPVDAGPVDAGPVDAGPVDAEPLGLTVIATFGSPDDVRVQGVEAADTTSAYLVGDFDGEFTIPEMPPVDAGVRRGFVLRMDTSGAVPWSHILEGTLANSLEQVDGDNTGVVVAGTFREEVSIAGSTETGDDSDSPDVLVAALAPDGGVRWSTALTSPEDLTASALRRWHERVRVGGQYRGSVADAGLATASTLDAYVATLSAETGALETSRSFALSSPGRDEVFAIEPSDPASEAAYWVAGEHGGTSSDGGVIGVLGEPTRSRDGFVHSRRFATDGAFWGITIGGSSSDLVTGLARISDSDVVLGMTASGNIMTDGMSGGLSGGRNVGVVQRRGGVDGTMIGWTTVFRPMAGAAGDVEVVDVVAQGGSVWVAGTFTTPTDFGLGPVEVIGSRDSFIIELSAADGSTLSEHVIQGVLDEVVTDIDIDISGNVWVSGWFNGGLDRPGDSTLAAMGVDGFVARVRVP